MDQQIDGTKLTFYGGFPPGDRTAFECPPNLSEDLLWGRIHVTGPAVMAGFRLDSTFYVVFLDKTHKFYLTRRARGE